MDRGSSINFQHVQSAAHSLAHSTRQVAPTYLLPENVSLGTIIVLDDKGNFSRTFERKMSLASRQAKAVKNYSPFWEGVINLRRPTPGEDAKSYKNECSERCKIFGDAYEKATGHKIVRIDVHLDEGHVNDDGEVELNAHAHVVVDRTNEQGRVIKLNAPQLRKVQDLAAEATGLRRGQNSLETGRDHLGHQAYRSMAEKGQLDTQKQVQPLKKQVVDKDAEIAKLKAQYAQDREEFKRLNAEAATAGLEKVKSQKDYQDLKKAHEAALEEAGKVPALVAQVAALKPQADKVPELVAKLKTTKIDAIKKEAEIYELKQVIREKDAELVNVKANFDKFVTKVKEHFDSTKEGGEPALPVPSQAPTAAHSLVVLTIDDTSTAAFEDIGRTQEAARIVRDAAASIAQGWNGKAFDLEDTNGNKVGTFEAVEGDTRPYLPEGGIRLEMPRGPDLPSALRMVADKLQTLAAAGTKIIRDAIGNAIASLTIRPPVPPAELDQHERPKGP